MNDENQVQNLLLKMESEASSQQNVVGFLLGQILSWFAPCTLQVGVAICVPSSSRKKAVEIIECIAKESTDQFVVSYRPPSIASDEEDGKDLEGLPLLVRGCYVCRNDCVLLHKQR